MELSTSLPPELLGVVDPSARGPAPLLESADADETTSGAAVPFALCLALLTEPLSSGEPWPPAGKDLPVEAPALEPDRALTPLPSLADAATKLRLAAAPLPALPTSGTAVPPSLPEITAPLSQPPEGPGSESPVAADTLAPALADVETLAASAADTEPTPLDAAASEVANTSAGPRTAPAAAWLEAFAAHEHRRQRPLTAAPLDPRAAAAPAAPSAASVPGVAPTPSAALIPDALGIPLLESSELRGIEQPKILSPLLATGDAASVSATDWLQPAVASSTTTGTVAAPPSANVPGTPIDLRSPSWHEAFANRVQWVVDSQVGEARIRLNPPELGSVDVKISLVDDKTYVQLTAATASARDELAHSLPRLRELFAGSGLELGGASVHNGRDGQHAGHGYGAGTPAGDSRSLAPFLDDGVEAPTRPLRHSAGRIDVFA